MPAASSAETASEKATSELHNLCGQAVPGTLAGGYMGRVSGMEAGEVSRKPNLPYDVRQECLWIVRGYDRRVKAYHEARRQIIDGTACGFEDTKGSKDKPSVRVYLPHGSGAGRPAESKAEQLAAIEDWPETQKMRAVEQAKLHIGLDLENEKLRQRLTEGILLNCQSHRKYPYAILDLPGISERTFRRRKESFLSEIAKFLGII
jgi:hypothetical protein